tara:strand:+ start:1356 stop:2336 length:981 start_codon:yes stop_codon:yes gene_type:complete
MKKIKLNKVFIIAEIGVNHNGDLNNAKKLIYKSKLAGADAVKFQTFDIDSNYSKKHSSKNKIQWASDLFFSKKQFKILKKYSDSLNLEFISTPFDLKSVQILKELKLNFIKIASSSTFEEDLVKKISKLNKNIIVSSGMQNISQIEKTLKIFKNKRIALLYCVSLYPSPYDSVNLNMIEKFINSFNVTVGFSDHSKGIELPIAAVAKGAKIIEKHIMLSKKIKCPDYKVSLTPIEFKKMVKSIRNVELSLNQNYILTKKEINSKSEILKGPYININIKKGQKINYKNIIFKKPQGDLPIENLNKYINKKINRNLKKDTLLLKKYFS